MDSARELSQLLRNDDILLKKRINLARNIFLSSRISVQSTDNVMGGKENVSVEWLCYVIGKGLSIEDAWDALGECILSRRLEVKHVYITSSTRSLLVSTMCELMKNETVLFGSSNRGISLITCGLRLLDVPIFTRHFSQAISDYALLMGTMLKFIITLGPDFSSNLCRKILHSLTAFSRKFYLNEKFRNLFSCYVVSPLSKVLENVESSPDIRQNEMDFLRCVHLTYFPRIILREEEDLLTRVLHDIIKKLGVSMKTDITLVQALLKASKTLDCDDFLPLLSLMFRSYICSCPKDSERHGESFLLLCCLFGFRPTIVNDRPVFSDRESYVDSSFPTIAYPSKDFALKSLKVLLVALNAENVSTNVDVVGHPCIAWLRALCENVISQGINDPAIEVLTALSELDPNVLDPLSREVIGAVMMRRNASTSNHYTCFLSSLLSSSVKVHRIQKLASRLLSSAKEELLRDASIGSKVTPAFVFPRAFLLELRESMQHLRVTQALAMLKTLMFHLLEDCIIPMESGQRGASSVLLLQLAKCIFCEFMVGYKAIDPNIPELQSEKFMSLMSELGSSLGRLGRALLLEKHSPDTMGAFLELSVCWGDLYMLLLFYQPDKACTSTEVSVALPSLSSPQFCGNSAGTATDFSCLHPHLTEGEWSHLVERIVNFGDNACKEMLDELVLQKLRMLVLFESRGQVDVKASCCVQHLLLRAGQSSHALKLLVQSQSISVPLLNAADLNRLMGLCLPGASGDGYLKQLSCSPLVAPVCTLNLLKQIGENAVCNAGCSTERRKRRHSSSGEEPAVKRNRGQAHELLRLVAGAASTLLEAACSGACRLGGDEQLESLSSALNGFLELESAERGKGVAQLDVRVLRCSLEALSALPLPHLPCDLRVLVSLCLSAVLAIARQQQTHEWIEVEIMTIQDLQQTLKAFNVFRELVSFLDAGKFLAFYISVDDVEAREQCTPRMLKELTEQQERLLEKMVELSMSRTAGIQQMAVAAKAVKARLKDGAANINLVCHLASLLMSTFSKKSRRSSSEKLLMKQLSSKWHESLAAAVLRRVDFSPSSLTRQSLTCLCLALERFCSSKDQKRLSKAGTFLPGVIEEVRKKLTGTFCNATDPETAELREIDCFACVGFVEKLLSMRDELKQWCPPMLVWSAWQLLLAVSGSELDRSKAYTKAMKTLLMSANKKEFKLVCNDLLEKTLSVKCVDVGQLSRYLIVWGVLAHVPLVKGLDEMRDSTLKAAIPLFLRLVGKWRAGQLDVRSVVLTLEFECTLLRSLKVSEHAVDLVLSTVSAASWLFLDQSASELGVSKWGVLGYQQVFSSCANSLLALVTHQMASLIDRIPSFLQQLLRLFRSVVAHGNIEYNPVGGLQGGKLSEKLIFMTDCSMSIEWVCSALVKQRKDFTRVCPYFIADMVCSFEDHIVHPDIKVHLHNCIYVFIYLCDSSAMTLLQHSLPAGARDVFRSIFDNYKKYYKFKGKI
ncbi:uncharacterized protein LOC124166608 [Ischnura elegans]|uniref:uncharacterized protein LOC124166608 n=1 Tax=Ischnura elegans TaxID=197161 RepID=UPI001ED8BD82|nr:uncharacterized protein LOC124166608 [Ischnura elegans]